MGEESKRQEIRGFLFVSLTIIVMALGAASVCLYVSRPGLGFWKTSSVVSSAIFLIWMLLADRLGRTKPAVKEWGPYLKFQEVKKSLFGLVAVVAVWTFYEFVGRAAYEWLKAAFGK